ncbi:MULTISPECIES: MFS transporter [Pseudomonas]|uniref:MFS transporter n=1 Tax=Pseudomonas TaxID=286 RepID=UPI000D0D9C99|nr:MULTISPECIES: MFS transporter [Pseudomonas]AZF65123.1 L-Proline/Glycine betaine transporter ProP [Pseudomonas sp. LBUM920]MBT0626226.1 MFS transporter [Pseudomonas fluorescens]PSL95448.1 MFS transporter [Pseudomonas sp. R9.37]TVT92171.1 MHS family MFS transporter [Pseudomonas sp. RGB]
MSRVIATPIPSPRLGEFDKTADSSATRIAKRAAIAAATGTAVEYYEFGVYGFMATIIAPLFFPSDNAAAALLATLAVFGSAFLIRPLGGILLGRLADRIGRRKVLLSTVIGMGTATAMIGLLPTAAHVGIAAPILLVLIRLAQGFFAGGEVIGAAAFLAESSPKGRRGFYGAFTPVGVAIGGSMAAIICGITTGLVDAQQLQAWAWRIPFFLAIPLVIFSCIMRHNVEETPEFKAFLAVEKPPTAPVKEVLTQNLPAVLRVVVFAFAQNAGYYIGLVFMNIYLTTYLHFEKSKIYWVIAGVSLCMAALMPFWGGLSDRIGRKKALAIGFVGYAVLVIPMMVLMNNSSLFIAVLAFFVATLPMPVIQSVGYPTYAEQFPTRVRYTGMAISINLGAILGGGITPYIVTSLIGSTGNLLIPGFFMAGAAVCALIALTTLRETSQGALRR